MKGGGIARIQSAIRQVQIAALSLLTLASTKKAQATAAVSMGNLGHPIHRMFVRANPMDTNRPGTRYRGFARSAPPKHHQILTGMIQRTWRREPTPSAGLLRARADQPPAKNRQWVH